MKTTKSYATPIGNGIEIYHHELGEGEPLVLLHGGGPGASGISNYEGNFEYFAEQGYRVLIPDIIGFGKSSKPSGVSYDFELLAGGIYRWLNTLAIESCSIVGNAMGGALAIRLSIDHPAMLRKMVLVAPAAISDSEDYLDTPGMQALLQLVRGPRPIQLETMNNLFEKMYFHLEGIDRDVVAKRTEAANEQPEDVFKNLALVPLKDELDRISCPVLMLWGAQDCFCPLSTSNNLLYACENSRLIAISGCGHWVQAERKDLFNRMVLDFFRNS